jgi:hypothetical protein
MVNPEASQGVAVLPKDAGEISLHSQDVLAGLGGAPRELLATCIALFEDSTLQQRLRERIEPLRERVRGRQADASTVPSLQRRVAALIHSPVPDQQLRLILWMHLREAMRLGCR